MTDTRPGEPIDAGGSGWKDPTKVPQQTFDRTSGADAPAGETGVVYGKNQRQEPQHNPNPLIDKAERALTILEFRLERYQDGRRLTPIPVVMKGETFIGFVHEGDQVQLCEPWQEGQIVQTNRVYNLTHHSWVVAETPAHHFKVQSIVFTIFMTIILGFMAWVLYNLFTR
jgi:hypothetical protein